MINMQDKAAGSMSSEGWKSYNLGDEVHEEKV